MRICLAISVVVHALIVLFLWLGPGARALNPAIAEPILVDLISPSDADAESKSEQAKSERGPDQAKPEGRRSPLAQLAARKPDPPMIEPPKMDSIKADSTTTDSTKPEPTKPDPTKTDPTKTAAPKPDLTKSDPTKPTAAKPDTSRQPDDQRTAEQKDAEERAATAARLAQLLDVPVAPGQTLAGISNGMKANLTGEEVANFKAQIAKCWTAPKGLPRIANLHAVIRVAFTPDGQLWDIPLVAAETEGAKEASEALGAAAGKALYKCQPFASLPADKFDEWRVLDVNFTPDGPSGIGIGGALN